MVLVKYLAFSPRLKHSVHIFELTHNNVGIKCAVPIANPYPTIAFDVNYCWLISLRVWAHYLLMGRGLISLPPAPSWLLSPSMSLAKGACLVNWLSHSISQVKNMWNKINTWKDNKAEITLEGREADIAMNYLLEVGWYKFNKLLCEYVINVLLLMTAQRLFPAIFLIRFLEVFCHCLLSSADKEWLIQSQHLCM